MLNKSLLSIALATLTFLSGCLFQQSHVLPYQPYKETRGEITLEVRPTSHHARLSALPRKYSALDISITNCSSSSITLSAKDIALEIPTYAKLIADTSHPAQDAAGQLARKILAVSTVAATIFLCMFFPTAGVIGAVILLPALPQLVSFSGNNHAAPIHSKYLCNTDKTVTTALVKIGPGDTCRVTVPVVAKSFNPSFNITLHQGSHAEKFAVVLEKSKVR